MCPKFVPCEIVGNELLKSVCNLPIMVEIVDRKTIIGITHSGEVTIHLKFMLGKFYILGALKRGSVVHYRC